VLDISASQRDLLFEPTPFLTWCEQLVVDFRTHWDGTHSRLYATRSLELRLVQELAQLRIPGLGPAQVPAAR